MARYSYRAVNDKGRVVQGQVEAANDSDLEIRVSNMGLDLIRYRNEVQRKSLFTLRPTRIERKELITFTYHLEQLLKAGVPIMEAMQDLRDSIPQGLFRDVIANIIENIGAGRTFSQALAQHKGIFGSVFISMVQVGERTGRLVQVLHDLTEMIKWQDELVAKARKMAIYPAFILSVVIGVVVFLMTYLVPQLIPFIQLAGETIPWYTQLLIVTSSFATEYWLYLLASPLFLLIGIAVALKINPAFRFFFDGIKLKLWLFGPLTYKIKIARFSNYFAMMYASGITVLDAIDMSKNVMNNVVLQDALDRAHAQITEGESISSSFANVGLFPALVVRMLRVGETTGAMTEALTNVSYFYSREVNESIGEIEPAIVPVITILLGGIVFWVMIAIMGPIYDSVVKLSAF